MVFTRKMMACIVQEGCSQEEIIITYGSINSELILKVQQATVASKEETVRTARKDWKVWVYIPAFRKEK
jgi:hypothetical protein